MSGSRPPRWLERVAAWALPRGLSGEGALGDLAEEFERRARESPPRARLWYAGQMISILAYRVLSGSGTESEGNSDLVADMRWSIRTLLKHPGFSIGVVAVLGAGLGANVAVYSVVDGTLDRTSWWADPDRTVAIWPDEHFSFGQTDLYQEETTAFDVVGAYVELAFALRAADGESMSVNGAVMTPALFRQLAVQPSLGRPLVDEDAVLDVEPVAVIGEGLWRRAFGADPGIVGETVDIGGRDVRIVGVQGAGGVAPGGQSDLWLPLAMDPRDDDFWRQQNLTVVGVLRDGLGLGDAFVDLMAYTDLLSRLFPLFYPHGFADGVATVEWADEAQRSLVATPLLLLLAGTALLLVVTALNVGNLLLGRAVHRRRELAVRAALGAGRGRIASQLLVEGTVLTGLALAVALAMAYAGGAWIARLFVEQPVVAQSSIRSPSVLGFALGVALLAWVVLNGIPLVHFVRSQRRGLTLRPDSGSGVQRALVTVQAALATLLLVSATLFVATVDNLRGVPLGFETEGLVAIELSPPLDRVESVPAARELYDRLVEGVGAVPGVRSAGLTGWLPLRRPAPPTPINLRSDPVDPREAVRAPMHRVDSGFFAAMDVEPVAGRLLDERDRAMIPSAIVVNESLARLLWPDGTAVGQMIATDPHAWDSWAAVVGVVPDMRSGEIAGPSEPALYVSLAESPARDITVVARTSSPSPATMSALRRAVREVDPLVPIRSVATMDDVVRSAYSTAWVMMGLLTLLAALATGLGSIGIYAVLAHHVALNRREIGTRMALGAPPAVVVGGVVRSGLALAGVGIVIGCLAAAASTRLLESLLFGVSSLAPEAFLVPALALTLAAGLAAWIPAARAGGLPPAEVLKSE